MKVSATVSIFGIMATMATPMIAGGYYFGVPQFVEVPQALRQSNSVDFSALMPAVLTPYGRVNPPNVSSDQAPRYDLGAGELLISLAPGAAQGDTRFGGQLQVRAVFDNGDYRVVKSLPATHSDDIRVSQSELGNLAIGSVSWQLVRVIPIEHTSASGNLIQDGVREIGGNRFTLRPEADMAAVLTRAGVQFLRQNKVVGEVSLLNATGSNLLDGSYLTGSKVQPMIYSTDVSKLYIGGRGKIFVIDTVSQRMVQTIEVPGSSQAITSLAVAGDLLLMGEGAAYVGGGRLLATSTNPASERYHGGKSGDGWLSIKGTGIENTLYGVSGMTVGPDGYTLVVSTPQQGRFLYAKRAPGNLRVLDLRTLNRVSGKIDAPVVVQQSDTGAFYLKSPQTITATQDPNRFLVSNIADYNRGLATLTLTRDPVSGKLSGAKLQSIGMMQPGNSVQRDRTNIQSAQSAVLVKYQGVEYAIVADDNHPFDDPYVKAIYEAPMFVSVSPFGPPMAVGGSASAKKVSQGGKLGIVRDPFGLQGPATYLGATLPLDGYGIVNLSLSEDGSVLLGQLKGGFGVNLFQHLQNPNYNQAWNVEQLLKAALAHKDELRKHIKLPGGTEQLIQVPANAVGWVAPPAGTVFDPDPIELKVDGNMGDVIEVDMLDRVARALLNLPTSGSLFGDEKRALEWLKINGMQADPSTGQKITFTGHLADFTTNTARGGFKLLANGDKITGGHGGLGFEQTGVLYALPNLNDTSPILDANDARAMLDSRSDMEKLRQGDTVSDKLGKMSFKVWIKDEQGHLVARDVILWLTARDAQHGVFFGDRPLDNPGYSGFTLNGTVGNNQANDRIDVARVEQRLRYLGYSAFGNNNNPGNPRKLTEFSVDGKFGASEESALKAFWAATNYAYGSSSGKNGIQTATTAERKTVTPGKLDANNNYAWLNAFNAPHWMNAYAALSLPTSPKNTNNGTFADGTSSTFEIYGTSWLVDLLRAWEQNRGSQGLTAGMLTINGISDPAARFATHAKGGHSVGMGLDIGFKQYIAAEYWYASKDSPAPKASDYSDKSGWSLANAQEFAGLLKPVATKSNQADALLNFLSLYALTINDGIANNGTWEDLRVTNGEAVRQALFGSGAQDASQMMQNIWLGNPGTNKANGKQWSQYVGMNAVMDRLGITRANGVNHAPTPPHEHHFHVDIRPPQLLKLPSNLLADTARASSLATNSDNSDLQELQQWALTSLVNETGDDYMFALPPADAPWPSHTTVLVAHQNTRQKVPVYGTCFPVLYWEPARKDYLPDIPNPFDSAARLRYAGALKGLSRAEADELERNAKEKVVVPPKLGTVELYSDPVYHPGLPPYLVYVPKPGYIGMDRMTVEVEMGGKTYRLEYFIKAIESFPDGGDQYSRACHPMPEWWRISDIGPSEVGASHLASWQRQSHLSALLASASSLQPILSDLPGTALGLHEGSGWNASITLDSNAAGHGWYVDATPWSVNDDYLPTSDPNLWLAKSGSGADGKMDMLSVWLHELGHAAGLDHTDSGAGLMGATLLPGQRRLPSTLELQQMFSYLQANGLVQQDAQDAASAALAYLEGGSASGQAPNPGAPGAPLRVPTGLPAAVAARSARREGGYTGDFDSAANPQLSNPGFEGDNGWGTYGEVQMQGGAATLLENATSQTRLNQVFVVNDTDRVLSFRLSNLSIDDVQSAPDDAFEVALINANTGASLLGGTGLTRNDAFFNLQADGAEHKAAQVSTQRLTDGSILVVVDLEGVAAGTVANLSFDLIGFGRGDAAVSSRVTVSDLRLGLGIQLVATDDTARVEEDGEVDIDVIGNDEGADRTGVEVVLVGVPALGTVQRLANGQLRYKPDANWHGEDRFTYRLSRRQHRVRAGHGGGDGDGDASQRRAGDR